MSVSLVALALSAFGIGTSEFVILGLLPNVAGDLGVSIPAAGWLVTGYALAVAFGAPFMALATARLPRKLALVSLMLVFIAGNLLSAIAPGYATLMGARIITALCHGTFFGIGSVLAAGLAPQGKRASAVALMFTGLTLANVLGVPLGTAIGQAMGWRAAFLAVVVIGVVALVALVKFVPRDSIAVEADMRRELRVLKKVDVWLALGMTVFSAASMFALFTYIAPILTDVTGLSPRGVTYTLLLVGVGLTIGNFVGGRLADRDVIATLVALFVAMATVQVIFTFASHSVVFAEVVVFLWAAVAFAAVPALQIGVVTQARDAPNLASTLNIGAFNVGNALGAWAGGQVLLHGGPMKSVPFAGAVLALVGLTFSAIALNRAKGGVRGASPNQAAGPLP